MTRNLPTLAELRQMTVTEAASLPIDILHALVEDVAAQKADTKRLDDKLTDALSQRYSDKAAAYRLADGKDTGRISLPDGDFIVRADLPKKVTWDQAKLASAVEVVLAWGESPGDYITTKLDVSETKFNAWPTTIRRVFEPARTVGVGKATFSIERRAA